MLERITEDKLIRACKKQEKKNLRENQTSYTWVTMLNAVTSLYLEEVQTDNHILVMKEGWRQFIKEQK